MSLSSFTLIVGAFCYVFGFPLVFSDSKFVAWIKKLIKDETSLRIMALPIVAIAVTTLRRQWEVTPDGEGAIVVLVWLTLLKGLAYAWFPAQIVKFRSGIDAFLFGDQSMQMFTGFVMVLLGALFTYLGLILA